MPAPSRFGLLRLDSSFDILPYYFMFTAPLIHWTMNSNTALKTIAAFGTLEYEQQVCHLNYFFLRAVWIEGIGMGGTSFEALAWE